MLTKPKSRMYRGYVLTYIDRVQVAGMRWEAWQSGKLRRYAETLDGIKEAVRKAIKDDL